MPRSALNSSAEALEEPLAIINLVLDPAAVYIGGRLPQPAIEELASESDARMRRHASSPPNMAIVSRAALATDAAAVGAAILPFSDQLMPSRTYIGSSAATHGK